MRPEAMIVVGTRPEAIKTAPVVRALEALGVPARLVATGQHRELAAQAFSAFGLRPDASLKPGRPGESLSVCLARMLEGLDELFRAASGLVIVHGDTATSYAAAGNLIREGVAPASIHVTGNTIEDAIACAGGGGLRERRRALARTLVLVTVHRRESLPAGIAAVFGAVRRVAARRPDAVFVCPLHPNPVVREIARRERVAAPNVKLLNPLRYDRFLRLVRRADVVLTDSGGLQEEAALFGKPVILARERTERPAAASAAGLFLAGTDARALEEALIRRLDAAAQGLAASSASSAWTAGSAAPRVAAPSPGPGAAGRIAAIIRDFLLQEARDG